MLEWPKWFASRKESPGNLAARSVWSAASLPALWKGAGRLKARASSAHSKRFAHADWCFALIRNTQNERSVNAKPGALDRWRLAWPVIGGVLGILVATIHLETGITFGAGFAAGCAVMALVLILSAHPIGARIGALLAGLFLAVPCFVRDGPFARALVLGVMAAPAAAAAALVLAPPLTGLRARVAYLFTYANTHPVTRRERGFDAAAFLRLIVATIILGAAIAAVKAAGASGLGLLVRWLAGEIAALAVAEMITAGLPFAAAPLGLNVPPLMQSPYRSASVSEFWAKRWNFRASEFLFRKCCFAPFARQGAAVALFVPFAISAGSSRGHRLRGARTMGDFLALWRFLPGAASTHSR